MKHLIKFEKWLPWLKKDDDPSGDLKRRVENELEHNNKIVLYANRFGKQIRSRVIQIPISASDSITVRRIGSRCQIKKGDEVIDIEKKEFNAYWKTAIQKKYKFIYK